MNKLKENLKYDIPASIVVFFVALPLCLGIALASGAPLFSGIIAGIIGGIVVGMFSGSALGVSGPAAGLTVLVIGYIEVLDGSWENFLVAVVLMGVIQIISGFLKLGTIAYYFPSSVIKGMLSGIGLIIILKQIPHAIGYNQTFVDDIDFDHSHILQITSHISHLLNYITMNAIIITMISMLILILWEQKFFRTHQVLKIIPGPLIAVVAGVFLSNVLELREGQIVTIPVSQNLGDFLGHFRMPNFEQLKNPQIYGIALIMAVVASLETLLCVEATDKLDPQKRVTSTNRELKAQGIGNLLSGLIGGLPVTQVIVRSSANINFGAKTKASTILHGFLLLLSAISIANILNMIPLASLACILLVVGYKLANPKIFKDMYNLGLEQFLPFMVTIIGMISFDLLTGVGLGMVCAVYFILYHNFKNSYQEITDKEGKDNSHTIVLSQEISFLNKGSILRMLRDLPKNCEVIIDGTKSKYIHEDIIEIIKDFKTAAKNKNIKLTLKGLKI